MTRSIKLVLDCGDHAGLADFWAAALGYATLGRVDNYTLLAPTDAAGGPQLLLQKVPEPKTGKNRMHLDITCEDVAGEAGRLEALGARRLSGEVSEHGSHWIVMADPEGNEFCVCDGGGS
jgi:predicted enzyme related to lactoylglutathione lyase